MASAGPSAWSSAWWSICLLYTSLGLSAVVLTTSGALKAMLLLVALCAAGALSARIFLNNNEKKLDGNRAPEKDPQTEQEGEDKP